MPVYNVPYAITIKRKSKHRLRAVCRSNATQYQGKNPNVAGAPPISDVRMVACWVGDER